MEGLFFLMSLLFVLFVYASAGLRRSPYSLDDLSKRAKELPSDQEQQEVVLDMLEPINDDDKAVWGDDNGPIYTIINDSDSDSEDHSFEMLSPTRSTATDGTRTSNMSSTDSMLISPSISTTQLESLVEGFKENWLNEVDVQAKADVESDVEYGVEVQADNESDVEAELQDQNQDQTQDQDQAQEQEQDQAQNLDQLQAQAQDQEQVQDQDQNQTEFQSSPSTLASKLFEAIRLEREFEVSDLVSQNKLICLERNEKGETPLILAVLLKDHLIIDILLQNCHAIELDAVDETGNTALTHAEKFQWHAIYEMLLDAKTNLSFYKSDSTFELSR